jgi:hypothetical protein
MALLNISVMTKDHKVQNAIFEINEVAAESLLSAIGAAPHVVPMEAMGRIAQGIVSISDARLSTMEEVEAAFRGTDPVMGHADGAGGPDTNGGAETQGASDGAQGGGDGNSDTSAGGGPVVEDAGGTPPPDNLPLATETTPATDTPVDAVTPPEDAPKE